MWHVASLELAVGNAGSGEEQASPLRPSAAGGSTELSDRGTEGPAFEALSSTGEECVLARQIARTAFDTTGSRLPRKSGAKVVACSRIRPQTDTHLAIPGSQTLTRRTAYFLRHFGLFFFESACDSNIYRKCFDG